MPKNTKRLYIYMEKNTELPSYKNFLLSIVIPAFNEEKRILSTLDHIVSYLKKYKLRFEIIVVDDGSQDKTVKIIQEYIKECPSLRIIENVINKGKGYSIRNGILQSNGDLILFSDADLSTPIEELPEFLRWLEKDYEIVIGSRALKESIILKQPLYRKIMGIIFNRLVQIISVRGIRDTQCGFKCFKKQVVYDLFSMQKLDRFSFDVEILYLAKKKGYKIKEIPVRWYYNPDSKVKWFKDSIQMFKDIFIIRVNDLLGRYKK